MAEDKPIGSVQIPPEIQEQAKEMVREVFRSFSKHNKKIAEDLAEFKKEDQAAKERMMHGARRTSGRII